MERVAADCEHTPAGRRRRSPAHTWPLAALILLVTIVINQSAVHWRSNLVDSHLFGYYGWCVSHGAVPYLDIWDNKPPGIWWLNAAAMTLLGPYLKAEIALTALALLVTLLALTATATRIYGRALLLPALLASAILLTDVRFECGSNRTETMVVAAEALAILGYVSWLRRRRFRWLLLAGLAAGAAPLCKQSGAAAGLACGLHLLWLQVSAWRQSAPKPAGQINKWSLPVLVGAALIVPAATTIALAAQGALGAALFAVGRFNRAYFAVDDASWIHVGRALDIYRPVLDNILPALAIAALGLLWSIGRLLFIRRSSSPPHRGVGVILLWFLLAAYLACVAPGRRGHHFMPALAPLALLTLLPLRNALHRARWHLTLINRPAVGLMLVTWVYLLAAQFADSLPELRQCWLRKPTWYALNYRTTTDYQRQADTIRLLTEPDERIYVWGWNPGVYRHARRLPTTRYATLEKLGQVAPHADFIFTSVCGALRQHPPRLFAISRYEHQRLRGPDDFAGWVEQTYMLVDTVAGLDLLLRIDDDLPALDKPHQRR